MKPLLFLLILSIFSCKTSKVQHSNGFKVKKSIGTYRVLNNVATTDNYSKEVTHYDKKGNKIKKLINICEDSCTKIVSRYNSKNKLLEEREYRNEGPVVFYTMTYDKKGKLKTEQIRQFKDKEPVNNTLIVSNYQFNEQRNEEIQVKTINTDTVGKVVVQKERNQEILKSYLFTGEGYELYSELIVTYNEAGKVISNEEDFKNSGEKIRTTYTYTPANEIEKFAKYHNEELVEQSFHTYENNLLKLTKVRVKSGAEWSKSKMEYVHEFW